MSVWLMHHIGRLLGVSFKVGGLPLELVPTTIRGLQPFCAIVLLSGRPVLPKAHDVYLIARIDMGLQVVSDGGGCLAGINEPHGFQSVAVSPRCPHMSQKPQGVPRAENAARSAYSPSPSSALIVAFSKGAIYALKDSRWELCL